MPLRRSGPRVPPEGLEPIYLDDEVEDPDQRELVGFIRFRALDDGHTHGIAGGWECFKPNRKANLVKIRELALQRAAELDGTTVKQERQMARQELRRQAIANVRSKQ